MQNFQYSGHMQQALGDSCQSFKFSNVSNDLGPAHQNNEQHQYFNDTGYLQHFPPCSASLADPTSLPPGVMHGAPCQRNSTRPHPPVLQTANLIGTNEFISDSPYSGYQQTSESPHTQLQTPMMPADHPLYMNGAAADSMTSFSPSSNTSSELDSTEGTPATTRTSLLDDIVREETPNDCAKTGVIGRDGVERTKRNSRRMWTHSLEKYIFTPHEIATLGTPHRRTIYSASLEAHIDRLHSQLLGIDLYPVHMIDLEMYKGLNCKIAKGMVAGLQHDFVQVRTQLLEIERAMNNAREIAAMRANHERIGEQSQVPGRAYETAQTQKHSLDSSLTPAVGSSQSTSGGN